MTPFLFAHYHCIVYSYPVPTPCSPNGHPPAFGAPCRARARPGEGVGGCARATDQRCGPSRGLPLRSPAGGGGMAPIRWTIRATQKPDSLLFLNIQTFCFYAHAALRQQKNTSIWDSDVLGVGRCP